MLKVNDLNLVLNNKIILNNISFKVINNSITVILGKNASGKSSLIKCINQTYKYTGNIYINDIDIKKIKVQSLSKQMSVLPQILSYPHIKVYDLISMGRNPYLNIASMLREEDCKIIDEIIDYLEIRYLIDNYLDEISGGQKQLVYLGMLLAQNTDLIILDEPTTFMDVKNDSLFMSTLKNICAEKNKTIVITMHNINQVIKYADNIIVLDDGKITFCGSKEKCLHEKVIEKTFGLTKLEVDDIILFTY